MAKMDPGWELYRSFLAVVREGSLSGAARTLGLAQPTVGRHVQELELSLGTALFTRGPSGLRPTDAAHTLEPYAQTMAGAAAALIRAISEKSFEARTVVRIAASEIIGVEVLPPIYRFPWPASWHCCRAVPVGSHGRSAATGGRYRGQDDQTETGLSRCSACWKRHCGASCAPPLSPRARPTRQYGAVVKACADRLRPGNDINPRVAARRA